MGDYKSKYKQTILNFAIEKTDSFLKQHLDMKFYAFAYDCNAEYAEVNLSFNTNEEFEETLKYYQTGEFSANYQTEEQIVDLKYNTGDWKYMCCDTIYLAGEEELTDIYGTDIERQVKELMTLCWEALTEFKETTTFKNIPKTNDFIAYCIDHDESVEDALKRYKFE